MKEAADLPGREKSRFYTPGTRGDKRGHEGTRVLTNSSFHIYMHIRLSHSAYLGVGTAI